MGSSPSSTAHRKPKPKSKTTTTKITADLKVPGDFRQPGVPMDINPLKTPMGDEESDFKLLSTSGSPKPIRIYVNETSSVEKYISSDSSDEEEDHPSPLSPRVESPKFSRKIPPRMRKLQNLKSHSITDLSEVDDSDTISNPDINEVIKCMTIAIYWNLRSSQTSVKVVLPTIFSEEKYPLDYSIIGRTKQLPEKVLIRMFLKTLFKVGQLSAEVGVMAMAYMDRVVQKTGATLHPSNWRRIVMGALILASKVWEEAAVWNVDFLCEDLPNITVNDLNRLERYYLNAIDFNVNLKAGEYAAYYYELRSLSENTKKFPVPLSKEKERRLEETTQKKSEEFSILSLRKTT